MRQEFEPTPRKAYPSPTVCPDDHTLRVTTIIQLIPKIRAERLLSHLPAPAASTS